MEFSNRGYSLRLPDARTSGNSEGEYIGMGRLESLGALKWIDEIVAATPDSEIVLYGHSKGGATVMMMMTSGEILLENVKAIVEDCGYISVWDEFAYQLNSIYGLPEFPIMQFSTLVSIVQGTFRARHPHLRK